MADSKRLTTLKRLCTFLATEVTPANGYKHDLSPEGAVARGRLFFDSADPLPGISILENVDPDRFPRQAGGEHAALAVRDRDIALDGVPRRRHRHGPRDPREADVAQLDGAGHLHRHRPYFAKRPRHACGVHRREDGAAGQVAFGQRL